MSYYDLLGVPPEATAEQIRSAYRTMVQLFHPDRLSHLKAESRLFAEERLKALNQAYEVLGDPAKRAKYDSAEAARSAPPAPQARSAPQWSPPPRPQEPRSPPPPPPPPRSPAYSPSNPYSAQAQPARDSAARGASDWNAFKRQAVLDNRRRLAQIETEIAELARGVSQLEADRERTQLQLAQQHSRTRLRFWVITILSVLASWFMLLIAAGIFSQPAHILGANAQRLAFALLVTLFEYTVALSIVVACRVRGVPISFYGTLYYTLRGLLVAWLVGLAGWAVWAELFGALDTPLSLAVMALVFALAQLAFTWFALGHLPRSVRDQQRVFEHSYTPMLQAYQHQLTQLRARKAVIESETV